MKTDMAIACVTIGLLILAYILEVVKMVEKKTTTVKSAVVYSTLMVVAGALVIFVINTVGM